MCQRSSLGAGPSLVFISGLWLICLACSVAVEIRVGARDAYLGRTWGSQLHRSQPRRLQELLVSSSPQGTTGFSSNYFSSTDSYNYWEGAALCSSYGGTIAVFESATDTATLVSLNKTVSYWIGLFNAAQMPGSTGSWVWANQYPYSSSLGTGGFLGWAPSQPPADATDAAWCVYITWAQDVNGGSWVWMAGTCSSELQVLCEMQPDPAHGLSCVANYNLVEGNLYASYTPTSQTVAGQSQECAEICQSDVRCSSFVLSASNGCQLRNGNTLPSAFSYYSSDALLSCFKKAADFAVVGVAESQQLTGSSAYSCITDFQVNLDVSQVFSNVCDVPSCVAKLQLSAALDPTISVMVHTAARCRCVVGANPMYGTDGAQGATPHLSITTCMSAGSWSLLGSMYDPQTDDTNSGMTTFTYHPEPLSWADAEAACQSASADVQTRRTGLLPNGGPVAQGHLASMATTTDLTMLQQIMSKHPSLFGSPAYNTMPDFYGFWVGLSGSSLDLSTALAAPPSRMPVPDSDTTVLRWTDGSAASAGPGAGVLQQAWGFGLDSQPSSLPTYLGDGMKLCLIYSNSSALLGPGLEVAGDCTWKLPFVCKTVLPTPNSANATAVSAIQSTLVPLAGVPLFLQPDSTLGPVWVPSSRDFQLAATSAASQVCGAWGGSLASMLSMGLEDALTQSLDPSVSYWTGLKAVNSSWQWAYVPQNVSDAALANFTNWCTQLSDGSTGVPLPAGFGRDGSTGSSNPAPVEGAIAAAAASALPMCGLLTYSDTRCSGWGWDPAPCNDEDSYLCQLPSQGLSSGLYYCVEAYSLGGTALSVQAFGNQGTPRVTATYCADACRSDATCHAFTLDNWGNCTLLSRVGMNPYGLGDAFNQSITVACFKHALMWDLLGGQVAIAQGVAADINSGYRCLDDQEVTLVPLSSMNIPSCMITDCTAQCFLNSHCSVVVYDRFACSCTLGNLPLNGTQGITGSSSGKSTCLFAAEDQFLQLGLSRGKQYIIPPQNTSGPSDLDTYTGDNGWKGGSGGATIIDLGGPTDSSPAGNGTSNGTSAPASNGGPTTGTGTDTTTGTPTQGVDQGPGGSMPGSADESSGSGVKLALVIPAVLGPMAALALLVAAFVYARRKRNPPNLSAEYGKWDLGSQPDKEPRPAAPGGPPKRSLLQACLRRESAPGSSIAGDEELQFDSLGSHSMTSAVFGVSGGGAAGATLAAVVTDGECATPKFVTPGRRGRDQQMAAGCTAHISHHAPAGSSAQQMFAASGEKATKGDDSMQMLSTTLALTVCSEGCTDMSSSDDLTGCTNSMIPLAQSNLMSSRSMGNLQAAAEAGAAEAGSDDRAMTRTASGRRRSTSDVGSLSPDGPYAIRTADGLLASPQIPLPDFPVSGGSDALALAAVAPATIWGCLQLADQLHMRASEARSNVSRCARLARHAHNMMPLLEKLGPRLAGTSRLGSVRSGLWSPAGSCVEPLPQGITDQRSDTSALNGYTPRPTASFGDCSASNNATPTQRSARYTVGSCGSGVHPASPSHMAQPSPGGAAVQQSPQSPLNNLVGPRAKAALLRMMNSSASLNRELQELDNADTSGGSAISAGGSADVSASPTRSLVVSRGGTVSMGAAHMSNEDAAAAVAVALVPKNSGILPAALLDALSPAAVNNERALADQVILDCHAALVDSLAWVMQWGFCSQAQQGADAVQELPGPCMREHMVLNDKLSASFSDLMYLALSFNINVEHQPGRSRANTASSGGVAVAADHSTMAPHVAQAEPVSHVRDLVAALVQQEWKEQQQLVVAGCSIGSLAGASGQEGAAHWLRGLSAVELENVRSTLAVQGHDLELLVQQSIASLVEIKAQNEEQQIYTLPPALLRSQLLAVLPQPPIPLATLAWAQESSNWPLTQGGAGDSQSSSGRTTADEVSSGTAGPSPSVVANDGQVSGGAEVEGLPAVQGAEGDAEAMEAGPLYDLSALAYTLAGLPVGSVFCGRYETRGAPLRGRHSLILPARCIATEGEGSAARVVIKFYSDEALFHQESAVLTAIQANGGDIVGPVLLEAITGLEGLPPALVLERGAGTFAQWLEAQVRLQQEQQDSVARQQQKEKVLEAVKQVVEAVAQLHSCGVVHGGIDSRHIMWFPQADRFKLVDLSGCLKAAEASSLRPQQLLRAELLSTGSFRVDLAAVAALIKEIQNSGVGTSDSDGAAGIVSASSNCSSLAFQTAAICHLLEGDISAASLLASGLLEPVAEP